MKNFILISIFLFGTILTTAQTSFRLDTIYANDQKNVALFFPEPIRQGITGSENFVFTYNRDKGQYFGLLQAKPGKESNLLVVNKNGSVFSYIVKYRKKLDRLNYFIPTSKSIGNEKPIVADSTTIVKREDTIDNRTYYYNEFCSYLNNRKQRIGRLKKRNEGVILSVENIVFDKEELYFVIQVENKSSLDYDLNFLKLSVETRKKGKKKSLQRLYQEPVFKYNLPSKVKENETVRLVYILPKFSIGNDRRAVIELNEKNGERNLKLKVSHRFINNPN
ncbi:DUF4138 domain-containing protein [Salegentibacter maritimus]|uniref:DUF4138 domain-containing protein n=1 Tax=Salegentibacter maritimus TaxID=2794347 RepID=A0ABS0TDS3_9FLAO|nr:DUF4138 domain-containing protein [Salegentibacter maritimus]MBI6119138.1 DUF4138 domain-containing protein [Salegentibacter maritimus]